MGVFKARIASESPRTLRVSILLPVSAFAVNTIWSRMSESAETATIGAYEPDPPDKVAGCPDLGIPETSHAQGKPESTLSSMTVSVYVPVSLPMPATLTW